MLCDDLKISVLKVVYFRIHFYGLRPDYIRYLKFSFMSIGMVVFVVDFFV